MLPFDFINDASVSPIRFKHDPESRRQLKEKKTTEELLKIIEENELVDFVTLAMKYNEARFVAMPYISRFEKQEDTIHIIPDDKEFGDFIIPQSKELEQVLDGTNLKLIDVFVYYIGNQFHYFFIPFDTKKAQIEFENSGLSETALIPVFLEILKIDSLHKLGKIINKAVELKNLG